MTLLNNEADRLRLWMNPMMDPTRGDVPSPRGVVSEASQGVSLVCQILIPFSAGYLATDCESCLDL